MRDPQGTDHPLDLQQIQPAQDVDGKILIGVGNEVRVVYL